MRTVLSTFLLLSLPLFVSARHGKGGVLSYEYLGPGAATATSKYKLTILHYIDCQGTQFIENSIFIGIFDQASKALVTTITIPKNNQVVIRKTTFGCINPAPVVCYVLVDYITQIELPDNTSGYTVTEQECCRIDGIINIVNSSTYGITNYNSIPGIINNVSYRNNSSPVFSQRDTSVICHDAFFTLDFGARDTDGDSLAYTFCSAKTGGTMLMRQPNPPSGPPYTDINYVAPYSGRQPLGARVSIDAKTGLISGIAPSQTGHYVISVCVSEYRNRTLINITKKEVQVEVADCLLSAAALKSAYINCENFSFTFKNEVVANVNNYSWDFGVLNSTSDVSSAFSPSFTYPDTGRYTLRLKVSTAAGCIDSAQADVLVYPGFKPAFSVTGSCYQNPFFFVDNTQAGYGAVNSWSWNFGDSDPPSLTKDPVHKYRSVGTYTATLIVGSTKGCVDTVEKTIAVSNRPELRLAFKDTLICSIDTLSLSAIGNGLFSWRPSPSLINGNSANPLVFPKKSTTYVVTLNESGCIADDSVKVNVLDFITLSLPPVINICEKDSVQLKPVSAALQYHWSPAVFLSNANAKEPFASPSTNTSYHLIANLGKCSDEASVAIKVIPYPSVTTGNDTTICFASSAQLQASIIGSSYSWAPVTGMQNPGSLSPTVKPAHTTSYVLTVLDTLGCQKPAYDTTTVFVLPAIHAFAGNDTLVVANQPLQLKASGGNLYSWSPTIGLNNPQISNPIAILSAYIDSLTYTVRVSSAAGCDALDDVKVTVFKTNANIYMPSAFSPDGNGKNDLIRPVLVGMKTLESFKIFSRWGQLVFSTNEPGKGWDGKIKGVSQSSGTYVYEVSGITYLGERIRKKGTVLLVR